MSSSCPTTSTGSPAAPQCFQNDKKVYKCDLCCKYFKSKRVLAEHMTPSHIERGRWCTPERYEPERYEGLRKLHPPRCIESPYDLERMKRLAKEEPYLIFSNTQFDLKQGMDKFEHATSPLWHAFKSGHVACFKVILEASKPENINRTKSRTSLPSYCQLINKKILANFLRNGVGEKTTCEMLKALLEHGVSPNLEIPVSEMPTSTAKQILIKKYKAKTLIFPSPALHMAITRNSPKILSLLLRHGEYPDPVMLTESGDVLPLYSTLGKHVNEMPIIANENLLLKILRTDFTRIQSMVSIYRGRRKFVSDRGGPFHRGTDIKIDLLKTLLAHGASLSPYQVKGGKIIAPETVFSASLLDSYRSSRREDELMELLKVYLEYGGTLWDKSSFTAISVGVPPFENPFPELVGQEQVAMEEFISQLLDLYNERFRLMVRDLNSMLCTVPSLQHACRIAIRRAMVYPCVRNVDSLPLPSRLINYIKFETESNI